MPLCSPELCHHLARELMRAATVGNPCPYVEALFKRMKDPRPGDVVVELSLVPVDAVRKVGVLMRRAYEPCDGWDVAMDGPNPGEEFWYLQTDAGETRWKNASFIAIPPLDRDQAEKDGWPR